MGIDDILWVAGPILGGILAGLASRKMPMSGKLALTLGIILPGGGLGLARVFC